MLFYSFDGVFFSFFVCRFLFGRSLRIGDLKNAIFAFYFAVWILFCCFLFLLFVISLLIHVSIQVNVLIRCCFTQFYFIPIQQMLFTHFFCRFNAENVFIRFILLASWSLMKRTSYDDTSVNRDIWNSEIPI